MTFFKASWPPRCDRERKRPLNMPQIVLCVAIARKEPLPLPASCPKVDHDCQCGQAVHCTR